MKDKDLNIEAKCFLSKTRLNEGTQIRKLLNHEYFDIKLNNRKIKAWKLFKD